MPSAERHTPLVGRIARILSATVAAVTDAPLLVVRARSGAGIGIGHLARTMNLAATWVARGGIATLVTDDLPAAWGQRAMAAHVGLASVGAWADAVAPADAVVVDGYDLGGEQARALAGDRLLMVVDDYGTARADEVDLVLDHNLGSDGGRYGSPALIGPRYALVPRERRDLVPPRPERRRGPVRRLVVSLGGAAPEERRRLAEQAIQAAGAAALDVVVLDGDQDLGRVLPEVDLALAAAGSTCWELCRFGVPSLLVTVAPNQVPVARSLIAAGAAAGGRALGPDTVAAIAAELAALLADPDRRQAMAEVATTLVDGWGTDRVVTRLWASSLTLRPVALDDADRLRAWRNDPGTRAASFDSTPVEDEQHRRWLAAVIQDATRSHHVATDRHGRPIGTVRFDEVAGGRADIGITVAPERRGEGWAAPLIDAGCRQLARAHGIVDVLARVKTENQASRRSFLAADFDPADPADAPNAEGWHGYSRRCDGR